MSAQPEGLSGARLRPMRWWDVQAAAALDADAFGATAWSPEVFWSELARPGSRCYTSACDGDGVLVGYAGLMVHGAQADVQTLVVAPSARGSGLGGRLLDRLLEQARARGARNVLLEVRAANRAARALYRRGGFEQVALRRGYYGPDGDAVIMRRVLG